MLLALSCIPQGHFRRIRHKHTWTLNHTFNTSQLVHQSDVLKLVKDDFQCNADQLLIGFQLQQHGAQCMTVRAIDVILHNCILLLFKDRGIPDL